jgi:hypothetical protein
MTQIGLRNNSWSDQSCHITISHFRLTANQEPEKED